MKLDDFIILKEFYEDIKLLKEKGIYPYEYIDSIEKLNVTQLPPIEALFKLLSKK